MIKRYSLHETPLKVNDIDEIVTKEEKNNGDYLKLFTRLDS